MLNKILKGIIAFTAIVVLAFVFLGLPKTNHVIESEYQVEKPIEEVYNYIKNVNQYENWLEGFIDAELIKGNVGEVRSSYKLSVMEFGKATEKTYTLEQLTPYSEIGYGWDKSDAFGTIAIALEPIGETTSVKEVHTFQGKGIPSRIALKLFKSYIVKSQEASQANLINAIEGN